MVNVTRVVNLIGLSWLHFIQTYARSGMKCSVVRQLQWSMQRFWTTSDQNSALDSDIHLYASMLFFFPFSLVDLLLSTTIFNYKLLLYYYYAVKNV